MWVCKTRGETFYVNHIDCNVQWSTKNTENNPHTKGSIKIKNCLLTIDEENNATITVLTEEDKIRLSMTKQPIIMITKHAATLRQSLEQMKIRHGAIRQFGGGCSTLWTVVSVDSEKDFFALSLVVPDLRKLMPNEDYHKYYVKGISEYEEDEMYFEDDQD